GLNFLEATRSNYQYLDDNSRNAIGYVSENDNDELLVDPEYGKHYCHASEKYRSQVLRDPCDGRPVYEWQVPFGLDEAHGYKDVSTAVDVLGNENALKNTNFEWKEGTTQGNEITLTHPHRNQQVILCTEQNAAKFQRGAELLLSNLTHRFSPTFLTDLNGCALASAWSAAFYLSPLWPEATFASGLLGLGLLAVNYRLWSDVTFSKKDLKQAFKQCRKNQCNVVLGDWMAEDYEERKDYLKRFDDFATSSQHSKPTSPGLAVNNISTTNLNTSPALEYVKSLVSQPKAQLDVNAKEKDVIRTYHDALLNRRIDVFAHVINNVEGEKIVVPIRDIDDAPLSWVSRNLVKRLTGAFPITKSPLKFDPYFERVEVAF
ncbi:hypothetical protein RFI_36204, partial [Reticulomyxa filosa]